MANAMLRVLSFPAYFCEITGDKAMQQLVEASTACIAARSFLSASARHLLYRRRRLTHNDTPTPAGIVINPEQLKYQSSAQSDVGVSAVEAGPPVGVESRDGNTDDTDPFDAVNDAANSADIANPVDSADSVAGDARLLSDWAWRYLEMGVRARICLDALRLAGREMTAVSNRRSGGGGHLSSTRKRQIREADAGGGARSAAAREAEEAAVRLEDGLSAGEMTG